MLEKFRANVLNSAVPRKVIAALFSKQNIFSVHINRNLIDISFSNVCSVYIDHEFRQNIVKVAVDEIHCL